MTLELQLDDLESYFASIGSSHLGEDAFLNLLTATLHDPDPHWGLEEVVRYATTHQEIELNALDLIPLLWTHIDKGGQVIRLLKLVSQRSSSKEALIGLLEVQERLNAQLSEWDEDDDENNVGERICSLMDLYSEVTPRITLRTKGPLDTLHPVIKGIRQCMRVASPKVKRTRGRTLLRTLGTLISRVASWLKGVPPTKQAEVDACNDLLTTLLLSGLASMCKHIHSHLAESFIEAHYPRKYLHTSVTSESSADNIVMTKVTEAASQIGISRPSLVKLATSSQSSAMVLASIVLLAHWNPPLKPISITKIIPPLSPFLQSGQAIDETLYLLLRYTQSHASGTIAAAPIDTLIQPLIGLCSTSPDSTQRNTAFITLSHLLQTLPSPARLAVFTELLSPDMDPFPQMRVAAVGLVKDSVLDALSSSSPESKPTAPGQSTSQPDDVFASPRLLTQIGRYILRSEPLDLLSRNLETFDVNGFFESSEPVRLTECLGLFYALLMRDALNKTGIRDRSTMDETKRCLLAPLVNLLDMVERRIGDERDPAHFIPVASLRMALERVHEALNTILPKSAT